MTLRLTSLAFAQLDPVLLSGPPYLHSVYYDKDIKFKIEGLEIGLEEILIVTTEVER